MEKQKRWQLYLILTVIILTVYNILPTIFYYSNPLKEPVSATKAQQVAQGIVDRVNNLEEDAKEWIWSFAKLLKIKPSAVELRQNDPRIIEVSFKSENDALVFKRFLPRAGALIPFVPSQLELYSETSIDPLKVAVARQIGTHFNSSELGKLFHFSPLKDEDGKAAKLYQDIVYDRVVQLAQSFAGQSKANMQLEAVIQDDKDAPYEDLAISMAKEIVEMERTLTKSPILKRYFASFTQGNQTDKESLIQKFVTRLESIKTKLNAEKETLTQEKKKAIEAKQFFDSVKQQKLTLIESQTQSLDYAIGIIRKNTADFKGGLKPLNEDILLAALQKAPLKDNSQILDLEGRNPYLKALIIDWNSDKIVMQFYDDVQSIRLSEGKSEVATITKEKLNLFLINEIARAGRQTDDTIVPENDTFAVNLNTLSDASSVLTFDLGYLAEKQGAQLVNQLSDTWAPRHVDLKRENYPIKDYASFKEQKQEDQKLGLVVYAPASFQATPPAGFRKNSIYVIARGLNTIMEKHRQTPSAPESQQLLSDIEDLNKMLQLNGFIGYPGSLYGMAPEFSKDYIFELDGYYAPTLKATREDFSVKGSKRYAVLDLSDVEQRIVTLNKIEDRIQEDLLKWKEEYDAAQVDLDVTKRYEVPAPTKNPYWENFKLSFAKYFRGDDRKILKWGLDLSGGKTVRIGLKDNNGKPVTNPADLNQAVNELYTRINKMGVAERAIHIESNNIILDFPGSQAMSASDLVKASAMYFHIVNEKFGPFNPNLKEAVNEFLQGVWNEAVITNRKDTESINEIAFNQLGGESNEVDGSARPRSATAQLLYDNGLRLQNPKTKSVSAAFDDTLSTIGVLRGDDIAEWNNQTHPLVVLFHNFALEGANLTNVQTGYDPSEGNILSFNVKKSYDSPNQTGSPREALFAWTSQFAEDKIAGTSKEAYSQGRGWRMGVVLNGTIISQPALRGALKDGGTISGRFSQREITQLAADLKAGSLSFTPRILSEENVSPELGQEERTKGIVASLVALVLVVVAMVAYYRFAGVVASAAVLFNILIMWGVLQNMGAALTLPGIAGIVLTIGMAVDANVLVFERVREEFKLSNRIGSAIQAGYRKAFSAIVDSNVTTIIAALILIQFDSGPIRGFAVTLIIGILSSMFTALFMTRFFFAGWVQNPKNRSLNMMQFIGNTHFDFLKYAKLAIGTSALVIIAGLGLFFAQGKSMLGMDFTGGYSLNLELEEKADNPNYRVLASDALLARGATANDFQIRELSKPNQLRIQMGVNMEEKGHPFYQMPEALEDGKYAYNFESNPRIKWIVDTLQEGGLQIAPAQLENLDRNWNVISGQFSDAMRNNAIIGLSIALLSILVYITFRFEFKFAIAAVIGLVHDVLITLGILALFHKLGFPVSIDLQVVGAFMTIIGYSLNDTIIIFDRIREDMRILRKLSFKDIINHALNVTLSRTMMTSGTTLLVLLALVLLGGKSIFAFSLVMTIGVIVGTLSSLFIASPVLLYFHNREVEEQQPETKKA